MNKARFIYTHLPGAQKIYTMNDMLRIGVYVLKSKVEYAKMI